MPMASQNSRHLESSRIRAHAVSGIPTLSITADNISVSRITTSILHGTLDPMSTKATVVLAFVAGLTGGTVSQRLVGAPVRAQAPAPEAKEIRAERFVLVDENGTPRGAFGIDANSLPTLELIDKKGHLWRPKLFDFDHAKPSVIPSK
jgi:hypothetical protein